MSNTKEIIEKGATPLSEDTELVCRWLERKQAVDNSLSPAILDGLDAIGCIQFELKDRCSKEEDYSNLLSAKIFQIFGVCNAGVAAAAFYELYNENNQDAWRRLYALLHPKWEKYANKKFMEGIQSLCLNPDRIPRLEEVNAFLEPLTGFKAKAVSGYVPTYLFSLFYL